MRERHHDLDHCIQDCLACLHSCQQTALNHCLPLGGKHVEPNHFRLMLDCATACQTAATLMMNGSPYHGQYCALCAELCRACASSCEAVGDMDDCVAACTRCAESCEAMAVALPSRAGEAAQRHAPSPS